MTEPEITLTSPEILQQELDTLATYGVSGAVMVTEHDRVHFSGAWGLAERESGRPWTLETISDIGSTSKQFTAAAILVLKSRGLLATSDPVGRFVPDVPAEKAGITIHHLLTHTSGLAHEHFLTDFDRFEPAEAEQKILASVLNGAPGDRFQYSNAGYTLLARIVERVSGESFRAFVRANLLDPAGMESTGWYEEPGFEDRPLAHGYNIDHDFGSPLAFEGPTWAILGTGGMISTVGDLQKWAKALRDGGVLPEEARLDMATPIAGGTYAYGNRAARDAKGRLVHQHGGGSFYGHTSTLRRVDASGICITGLWNTTYQGMFMVSTVANRLTSLVLDGESMTGGVQARRPARFVAPGMYRAASGATFEVWEEADSHVVAAASPAAVDVLIGSDVADRIAAAEQPAVAAVNALLAGDDAALGDLLDPRQPRDITVRDLKMAWRMIHAEQGAEEPVRYLGGEPTQILFEVTSVGPQPEGEQLITTYVRLTEVTAMRFVFSLQGIIGLEDPGLNPRRPAALRVGETADGELLALDVRTGRTVPVRIGADSIEVDGEQATRVSASERSTSPAS